MLKREGLWGPVLCLLTVLGFLLLAGTFFDYEISSFLYTGELSLYGRILGAFGELPAFLLMASAGVILIYRRGKSTRLRERLHLLCGVLFVGLGAVLEYLEFRQTMPHVAPADAAVTVGVLFLIGCGLTVLTVRDASREEALRFAMAAGFVCCVSMGTVNLLKLFLGRPRMYFLVASAEAEFVPWYSIRVSGWSDFLARLTAQEEYRSFPSGHTAAAACTLVWTFFPALNRFFEGKGRLLFLFSLIWTGLVAFSRLVIGAHFLSDAVASWIFTVLVYLFSFRLFYTDSRFFAWIYKRLL